MLVDTHAHLDEFENLKSILDKARKVGVAAVIAVGSSLETNLKILNIGGEFRRYVYPALGAHPWNLTSDDVEGNFKLIEEKIDKAVAIGEVGLDFWVKTDRNLQVKVFKRVVELSVKYGKPLSIHSRGAWSEAFEIVKSMGVEKAVFHWYTGPENVLNEILDSGYYVSATPAAQYSRYHIEAVKRAPLERLLLETDCPVVYKGVRSDPSSVVETARAVSSIKNTPVDEVAEKTTRNAVKLFKIGLHSL
ncbi:TatD family hydrolase [Candidatus Bathyarchaeota archaeon]|nr:TatD family hydrolase [Candidatus Bathyarchaeota archaeon]MBS7614017.1 TatD family hydrolase [Candidatus Bathyarchaeota archaeon]